MFVRGIVVVGVMLDKREDGDAIQAYLQTKTGQRTVPNVFIKQEHIGGNDDLQAFNKAGELRKALSI